MNRIKPIVLLLIIVILTGCSSKTDMTDNLANKIIDAHKNSTVDTTNMSKEEQRLFYKFLDSEVLENKIVNISENIEFSDQSYTDAQDTYGLYEENGNYYIKYTDIKWEQVENDYRATISLNHEESALFKSLIPILYDDTHDKDKYNYIYMNKNKTKEYLDYYYKSITDGSGLIIRFYFIKNKIEKISTIYQDIYNKPEDITDATNITLQTIILIVISIIVIGSIVIIYKKNMS